MLEGKQILKHQSKYIQRWAAHLWQVHMSRGQCGTAAACCCFGCFGLCWRRDGFIVLVMFILFLSSPQTNQARFLSET